jgi:ABC-2 type transport system ATP-binding protein
MRFIDNATRATDTDGSKTAVYARRKKMLLVKDLRKRYRHLAAVDGISFALQPGEIVGLVGPNGAGKSTTLKILSGLIRSHEGQIQFRGRSLTAHGELTAYRQAIGYLPENADISDYLSGHEFLSLVGALHRLKPTVIERRIAVLCRGLKVDQALHHTVSSYSKGMKQKVLVAATLLHDPQLLLLDEPFSGLDFDSIALLKLLLRTLADRGKTILYSSHIIDSIEDLCQRVLVITQGKLVLDDRFENLQGKMQKRWFEEIFNGQETRETMARTVGEMVDELGR